MKFVERKYVQIEEKRLPVIFIIKLGVFLSISLNQCKTSFTIEEDHGHLGGVKQLHSIAFHFEFPRKMLIFLSDLCYGDCFQSLPNTPGPNVAIGS